MADGPTLASGELCYLQIPATDIPGSADFYESAFGLRIRRRDDGEIALIYVPADPSPAA
jgi:uncharacterized protein